MSNSLEEIASVYYGRSPNAVRVDESVFCIYGTGGQVGFSREPLFAGPIVVVARKGTLSNPTYSVNPCWVIDTAYAVVSKKNFDTKWLYYNLSNYDLESLNEATGVPSISRDYLYRIRFYSPPLPQQRKIAKILTTVDNLIEKTEALIAKYQSIKQGMMHDLFTRGVDANGKLRPTQSEAPELYKQSELGWIPKEWEVGSIASISTINPSVSIARFDALTLVSFLTMSDVSEDGRILNHQIRNLKDVKNGFTRFEEGDILFAKITPCMENGKGALAKNLQNKIGFGSTEFHVIRANEFGVPAHIYHLCQSKNVRAKATNFFSGSAGQQRVDSKFFFDYQLPVFSINEQRQIAALLSENDLVIVSLQKGLLKYKQLKNALMQDLLTGKVQVTPDAEDKELAHA